MNTRMEERVQPYPTVYVSSHAVHENAEKIVQKKLLIESVRTRLYILFLQKVLDRKRMGSNNTYHYKKL
ncbi:hypothetical protein BDE36_1106 [Arcticibacter tournemirensis]|uniref:Uncharacterized protein n=1 Tax=Arcticibacter tournemirensis TaxID=699437 RepID=A0A5M9GHY6_9SPHI|nr:hypothetical protein [Arcticibacter tournemirensis]KAA8473910.1 hypothetical protein F1649_22500 [Arcticibacter tournemirensis]TQM49403.1 hypothetical protein BDE36_1106 [Arcticibacter tournemirensis]